MAQQVTAPIADVRAPRSLAASLRRPLLLGLLFAVVLSLPIFTVG